MSDRPDRRRFVKTAALGVAGLAASEGYGQAPPPAADARARTAQALAEIARLRFGQHLNEAQLKSVQERIGRSLATAEALKRTRLENGDEPAFVFAADA